MSYVEDTATGGDITTDAGFRAWGLALRTALTSAGIVRTSDTGQIDFSTVSAPGTSSYAGYDIFRFDDAAQGADPVFFKLEYGKGSATTRHALRLTVGTGSDGAGTLTNASSAMTAVGTATASGNTSIGASFFDGALCLWDAYTSAVAGQVAIVIERARDINGDLIAGNFAAFGIGNAGYSGQVRTGGSWSSTSPVTVLATDISGGNMILGYYYYTGNAFFTLRALILGNSSIGTGESGAVDVNGVSCTYKRLTGNGAQLTPTGNGYGLIRTA